MADVLVGIDDDVFLGIGNRGFDLDAMGAFVVPARGYPEGGDLWQDVGGRPGIYDEGIDTKIFDGNNGYQITDGAVGLQRGLYYHDQDASGGYTGLWSYDMDTNTWAQETPAGTGSGGFQNPGPDV